MKPFLRMLVFVVCFVVFKSWANPSMPLFVSELQVTTPSQWEIELNRNYLPLSDTLVDTVSIKTSRYSDTFHVRLRLLNRDVQKYAIITSDSIDSLKRTLPFNSSRKVEIQKGDTVSVLIKDLVNRIIVSYVGPDSSMCGCSYFQFVTTTPTIGSENVIPSNQITLYVLSSKDSLPVSGLGLYANDGIHACPQTLTGLVSGNPVIIIPNACNQKSFYILDGPCGNSYGSRNYSYSPGALPRNDTVFITTLAAKNSNITNKTPAEMSIVNSPSSLIFVIKGIQNNVGRAKLDITAVNGRLVRSFPITVNRDGTYSIGWDRTDSHGKHMGKGVYLAKLDFGGQTISKRFSF